MAQRILAVHGSLSDAGIAHAFGGAIALAYHTLRPRATNDIELNVAVAGSQAERVLRSLPPQVRWTGRQLRMAEMTGEVKVRWLREGPVDLFFAISDFHLLVDRRKELRPFCGAEIPVLSATDLAVFKARFGRERDWVDIDDMLRAGTVDVPEALARVERVAGLDARLRLEVAARRAG